LTSSLLSAGGPSCSSPGPVLQRQTSFQSNMSEPGGTLSGRFLPTSHSSHNNNKVWKSKGVLAFNLIRFRNKFLYIFFDIGREKDNAYMMNSYSFVSQPSFITYHHRPSAITTAPSTSSARLPTLHEVTMNIIEDPKAGNMKYLRDYQSLYDLSEQLSRQYQEKAAKKVTAVVENDNPNSNEGLPLTSTRKMTSSTLRKATSKSALQTHFPYYRRYPAYYSSNHLFFTSSYFQFLNIIVGSYYTVRNAFFHSWQQSKSLIFSTYQLLFGSNELVPSTNVYESINKDISILESPDNEISIIRKIEVTKRMRRSYKMLSPVSQ
jgi:hypothetical protein